MAVATQTEMRLTNVFERNATAFLDRTKKRACNEGGSSSSKTMSVLQAIYLLCRNAKKPLIVSVVSESMPHLKRGAILDWFDRIVFESQENNPRWNKTEAIYTFPLAKVNFFGADEGAKLRGGRRDILFINEANNVSYDAFNQLDMRTQRFVFLDWNPVGEFWAHEHLKGPENVWIKSTYKDAINVIPQSTIEKLEAYKTTDPNYYHVFTLGLMGKIEGLVYPHFEQVECLPTNGNVVYGLDFGFAGDPSVLTRNVLFPDNIYSEELIYQTGLTNQALAARMKAIGIGPNDEIYADSAEPKSIEEIHREGFNIKPAPKGADSVEFGHQKVRQLRQFWTADSKNCIKEQQNFRYVEDKDGKLTEKTTHVWSHGMDSRRYAVVGAGARVPIKVFSI